MRTVKAVAVRNGEKPFEIEVEPTYERLSMALECERLHFLYFDSRPYVIICGEEAQRKKDGVSRCFSQGFSEPIYGPFFVLKEHEDIYPDIDAVASLSREQVQDVMACFN